MTDEFAAALNLARSTTHRTVRAYGWTDDAGTYVFPIELPDPAPCGMPSHAVVCPDGTATDTSYVAVMDEIDRMRRVGEWPADLAE